MSIKLYIYDKETKLFSHDDLGDSDFVILDLADNKDFTLTAIPDRSNLWYWINAEWVLKGVVTANIN